MYIFDHEKRIKRYQESLKAEGVGCAIVIHPTNVRYLTGFWGYAARSEYYEPRRIICVVVPQEGRPLLVVPKIERTFADAATVGLDIQIEHHCEITVTGERKDSWGIVREFIERSGFRRQPVSFEAAILTPRSHGPLEENLSEFRLVEASDTLERHRWVKDPVELRLHRACGQLAADMFNVELAAIRQGGFREYEVAMKGWEHNVHACAKCIAEETPNEHFVDSPIGLAAQILTSGPRLNRSHGIASTRVIEPTDFVAIDLCRVPFLLGMRTGFGRIIAQRPLSSTEEDINAAIRKAYDAALDVCRPGAVAREINQAVTDTLVSAGLGPYIVHGCGRSFGFETEIKFSEDNTRTLEADMIVSIEPSVYMDGFQARIESSLRITNGRPELLTPIHEGVIIA